MPTPEANLVAGMNCCQAKWAHSEAEAQRLLVRGLAALGLPESELAKAAKGAGEKQVLAWWLCQHTTARRRWVSERLGMGDESRVTQAIRSVKRRRHCAWEPLKEPQAYQSQPGKAGI